ncbi:ATP-binding cassette domain-containing protein [Amycolatopsis keratiniphila]|uniref:ATP-binding cassette domain-containing protein n=1 Tax=Amycolatopsis keratiniphila TaxID=129921 RepID=UPI003F4D5C26
MHSVIGEPHAAVQATGLSKRFGRTLAVDDLSLSVPPGEVFGFLGPNGAGKSTTTIRSLLGFLRPRPGRRRWPDLTGPGIDPGYRAELVRRFEIDLGKPARTYSTGNRWKVVLVAAFASRAPLLVMD